MKRIIVTGPALVGSEEGESLRPAIEDALRAWSQEPNTVLVLPPEWSYEVFDEPVVVELVLKGEEHIGQ